ncbi:hypothetical protein [Nocardioides sp. TF02-7]|uniref:hypothetical protein n=1 Tax=Nocardioides sp. TF02-7 TaxID=2917724 RepID=UPI001F05D357|nr:hypothetical protein [Nocardioides sp. TF02-7]UMG92673.1 hypothetical protein MF408_23525 [Nocardioides sp. TF02-7]
MRVLVAEVVVAGLARRLGLRTPDLVVLDLDPEIARYEADEEVQDLLNASAGLNLGVDFLPGAFGFDGEGAVDPEEAARVIWLDAFTANVDRSWRNPQPAVVAGRPVADRPRRLALLPPQLGGRRGRPRPVRRPAVGRHRPRARLSRRQGRRRRRRPPRPAGRRRAGGGRRRGPGHLAGGGARRRRRGRAAGGVRRLPDRPARHPRLAPGGAA